LPARHFLPASHSNNNHFDSNARRIEQRAKGLCFSTVLQAVSQTV